MPPRKKPQQKKTKVNIHESSLTSAGSFFNGETGTDNDQTDADHADKGGNKDNDTNKDNGTNDDDDSNEDNDDNNDNEYNDDNKDKDDMDDDYNEDNDDNTDNEDNENNDDNEDNDDNDDNEDDTDYASDEEDGEDDASQHDAEDDINIENVFCPYNLINNDTGDTIDTSHEPQQCPHNDRITKPIMTKYERVRILSTRATQLSKGAKCLIKHARHLQPLEIAEMELEKSLIPFKIKRPMPEKNMYELWEVSELQIIN